jgi:hypothetical protein
MRHCCGSRIGKSTRRKADGCHRRRGSSPRGLASGALVQIVAEDVPAEGHVVTMLACIAWTAPSAWRDGAFIDRLKQKGAGRFKEKQSPTAAASIPPTGKRRRSGSRSLALKRETRFTAHGRSARPPPVHSWDRGAVTAAGFGSRNAALTASSPNSHHPIRMCVVPARRHRPPLSPTALYPIERYRLGSNLRDRL